EHDQHAADRREQPCSRGPEPGERQPADPANPAAAGSLGTVDRQPSESIRTQIVPVSSGAGLRGTLLAGLHLPQRRTHHISMSYQHMASRLVDWGTLWEDRYYGPLI